MLSFRVISLFELASKRFIDAGRQLGRARSLAGVIDQRVREVKLSHMVVG